MDAHLELMRQKNVLSMDISSWNTGKTATGRFRDAIISLDYFESPSKKWEMVEVLTAFAMSDTGPPTNHFFLSLLIDSYSKTSTNFDLGAGRFTRPVKSGAFVFCDEGRINKVEGEGPYHSVGFRFDRNSFLDYAIHYYEGRLPNFDKLHASHFEDEFLQIRMMNILRRCREGDLESMAMESQILATFERLCFLLKPALLQPSSERSNSIQLTRVTDYIQSHLSSKLTISSLAQEANISYCHFERLFLQAFRKTPTQYIRELRLEKARMLLSDPKTDLSLNEIAAECGFSHQSHLGREFQKAFGTSPGVFRSYFGSNRNNS